MIWPRASLPLPLLALATSLLGLGCRDSSPPPASPIADVDVASDAGRGPTTAATAPALSAAPPAALPSAAPAAPVASAPAAHPATAGDLFACTSDADCVAVPKNECCNNGHKEAVNKTKVDAYKASFVCPHPNQMCPHYMVNDTRSAVCDAATHRCVMSDKQ